jgi:hypothetical protein
VLELPRPSKTVRRQKVAAGLEWKKGNREEAQKIWLDADKARKELQAKKHNKKKAAEPAEEAGQIEGTGEAEG